MTDPVLLLPILLHGLLCVFSALWILRWDMLAFEISFAGCGVLTLSGLGLAAAGGGLTGVVDGLIAGAVAGIATGIVHVFMPARLGRGDIVLVASMGAVTGTALMPVLMVIFLAFCAVTSGVYSLRRGKRLFRSAFPAALPAMAALVPVLIWRHSRQVPLTLWETFEHGPAVFLTVPATVFPGLAGLAGHGWLNVLTGRLA